MLGIGAGIIHGSHVDVTNLQEATGGTAVNLLLWLKNNTAITVARWDDASGNNNHANQSTEANQAAVTTDGGLDFERDNSDHYDLTTKIDIADDSGFCVAVVLTRETNTAGGILSDNPANETFQITNNTTLRLKTFNSSSEAVTTDAVFPTDTFAPSIKFVLLINRSAGEQNQFTFMKNGSTLTPNVDSSSNEAKGENPGGIEFKVLGSNAGTADFFDGIIHEVAVWNRALTTTEIADVNSYLQEIHGL